MDIEFSLDEDVRVTMMDYLKNIVYEFPETIQGRVKTPATDPLSIVREDANMKLLEKYWATTFHHSVAQIIFTTTRVRKDIQTAVAFLTTRVRVPGMDDWQELRRVLQ